jgi:hypothetical protein
MIETHTIRLRGPWQCIIGERRIRVPMPAPLNEVAGDDYHDRLVCLRKFGCPTCLDPHERVWLVIEKPARPGYAMLNWLPLGPFENTAKPTEFEITHRLGERNELSLAFSFDKSTASAESAPGELLFKEVRLEIRG